MNQQDDKAARADALRLFEAADAAEKAYEAARLALPEDHEIAVRARHREEWDRQRAERRLAVESELGLRDLYLAKQAAREALENAELQVLAVWDDSGVFRVPVRCAISKQPIFDHDYYLSNFDDDREVYVLGSAIGLAAPSAAADDIEEAA